MFWLGNKKINFSLWTLIWRPVNLIDLYTYLPATLKLKSRAIDIFFLLNILGKLILLLVRLMMRKDYLNNINGSVVSS